MISKLSVHESKFPSQCSCPVFLPVCHQILITIAIVSLSNNNYFLIQLNCETRLIYSAKNSHVSCTNKIFFFITKIFFHYKSNLFSLRIKSIHDFFLTQSNNLMLIYYITTVSTHKRCHFFWSFELKRFDQFHFFNQFFFKVITNLTHQKLFIRNMAYSKRSGKQTEWVGKTNWEKFMNTKSSFWK